MLPPIRQHDISNSPQPLFPHPPVPRGEPCSRYNPRPCVSHMHARQQDVPDPPHPLHPAQHNVRGGVHVLVLQGVSQAGTKNMPPKVHPNNVPLARKNHHRHVPLHNDKPPQRERVPSRQPSTALARPDHAPPPEEGKQGMQEGQTRPLAPVQRPVAARTRPPPVTAIAAPPRGLAPRCPTPQACCKWRPWFPSFRWQRRA